MITNNDIEYVKYCDGFYRVNKCVIKSNCYNCYCKSEFINCRFKVPYINNVDLIRPLVLNWNITGKCQNYCSYCYGDDINVCNDVNSSEELDRIIGHLQHINPNLIVVSGGEPLLHKNLYYIIKNLNFSNTIIDTNGLDITEEFLDFVSSNNIHLRVSLDSEKEFINTIARKSSYKNSTNIIIENIKLCIKNGILFSIQTVLTNINCDSILQMGDYLISIGVKLWRIHIVTSSTDFQIEDNILDKIVIKIKEFAQKNRHLIKIRLANNGLYNRNSIILINPEGKYYIRNTCENEKELIDQKYSKMPDVSLIMKKLDNYSHLERYLYEGI